MSRSTEAIWACVLCHVMVVVELVGAIRRLLIHGRCMQEYLLEMWQWLCAQRAQ